ncbi:peptidylprolyl isomerase [Bengtsoniella intestinalis]|uniref:peptidylprolyl isomerase n=1 Tax=Bengtsoniella intestinalis TaxID=3073143 RepID=UPI00391EF6E4
MNPNEQELQEELDGTTPTPAQEVVPEPSIDKVEETTEETATEATTEEAPAGKKSSFKYIIIAAVLVIASVAAIALSSGSKEETQVSAEAITAASTNAVTINGVDYSAAELNYHVINTYQSFVSSYSTYLSYFGLDTSISLKEQYSMDGTATWYEYFLEEGMSQMATIISILEEAEAAGYVFDDTIEQSKQAYLAEIEMYAPYYGYADGEEYLQSLYGSTMTLELYEKLLEQSLQAEAYSYAFVDSLIYDEATLQATYEEYPDNYDMVECEYLYVYNPVPTVDEDGNAIEVTEEMTAAALAESEAIVTQMYEDYTAGASLADVATSSDLAVYQSSTTTAYGAGAVPEWLFDQSRQTGDSSILVDEDYGVYYIVIFHDRYLEDYNLIDVRHILLMPATGTLISGDDGYEAEVAALDAAALANAQAIYDEFLAGDQSEDSFATLANTYSEDPGSNTTGGLYSMVAKGEMVEAFENWCFDETRQVGDSGIVETEYGYHIMYFSGFELPYWQATISATLAEADYTVWYNELQTAMDIVPIEDGLALVGSTL